MLWYCLDDLNEETENIRIDLDTMEYIDENDEKEYQKYLEDAIKLYLEKKINK